LGFVAETILFIYNITSKIQRQGAVMANLATPKMSSKEQVVIPKDILRSKGVVYEEE